MLFSLGRLRCIASILVAADESVVQRINRRNLEEVSFELLVDVTFARFRLFFMFVYIKGSEITNRSYEIMETIKR